MAILNESEMLQRLAHEDNYCRGSGRTLGAKNLPDKIRELAGFNAHFEKAKAVASAFGIAPITAHMAKRSENFPVVKEKIEGRLEQAKEQALNILMGSLNNITEDKVAKLSVKTSIRVAKDAAGIIEAVTPKATSVEGSKILIYAPRINEEKEYEAIEIIAEQGA